LTPFQEPKENGPLFVEMHFYNRNAKHEEIETFRKSLKLKTLGMPEFIAMGSHEIDSMKHRFIVLPRFGRDIWKIFQEQNNKFPLHTVYRIGYQVLNVLEFIHRREYVHMDIKGTNILLGFGKGGDENVYLVDFGLACHHNTKEFKPDPKKMHNGTIEYTSRDAHQGVPTMRGDLEVLAYNLIEWSGAKLPWVEKKLLAKPVEVQKSKEEFMKNFEKSLSAAYGSAAVPSQITAFFKYLLGLKHDTQPDYGKLRGIFEAGIKELSQKNSGPLEFGGSKAAAAPAAKKKAPALGKPDFGVPSTKRAKTQTNYKEPEEVSDSEEEVVPKKKPAAVKKQPAKKQEEPEPKAQKRVREAAKKKVLAPLDSDSSEDKDIAPSKSPQKKPRIPARTSPRSTSKENDEEPNVSPPQKKSKSKPTNEEKTEKSDGSSKGTITMKSKSSSKGNKKTIQLNFNLDVSVDSDLVVVVNRKNKDKKKEAAEEPETPEDNGDKWANAGVYKGKQAKTK
jgi:vaccinia related kinase